MSKDFYENAGGRYVPVPPIPRALVERCPPGQIVEPGPDGTIRLMVNRDNKGSDG